MVLFRVSLQKIRAMNISHIRLLNQQLVSSRFTDVHDLVAWMGMVQAQEYKMMRWAVGMRLREPSMRAFREAYDAGRIVRTHLFRCTWQLVAAEDLGWMLPLCAERNKVSIRGYLAYHGRRIEEREYERANRLICDALSGEKSVRKEILLARLAQCGLEDDAHTMSIYLRRAEADGIICSGELDRRQNTYALVEERIPRLRELRRDEAIAELARRYFRSHSPATLEDFVWWSNLGVGECRAAIESVCSELITESYAGVTYFIHRDCRVRGYRRQTILLPSYDEYLIGYKSRHHAFEEEFRHRIHSSNGLFYPVILHDGQVVGNWHTTREPSFFRDEMQPDVADAFLRYRQFWDSDR